MAADFPAPFHTRWVQFLKTTEALTPRMPLTGPFLKTPFLNRPSGAATGTFWMNEGFPERQL